MARRRTHRCALAACGVFAVVVALALFRPAVYQVGPLTIKLTSLRNPLLELAGAILVAVATSDRRVPFPLLRGRASSAWRGLTPGGRVFALALTAKLGITAIALARASDQFVASVRWASSRFDEPLEEVFARRSRYVQFERFFERCRRELPEGARVLYLGRAEGQVLAYVLYPRPVFMHPADGWVAWVGHQALDLGSPLRPDELFPASVPPPLATPALDEFVAAHRITHVVQFVESDLTACRIRAVR